MRKLLLVGLFALLAISLAALIGLSNAWSDQAQDDAVAAVMSGDYRRALQWARPAAEKGNIKAQFMLGDMYSSGAAGQKDQAQAFSWYRKAAAQGYAPAQLNVGSMFKNGEGVIKNEKEAVGWYRKAAEQGSEMAQQDLGWMYQNGLGVSKDYKEALYWYRKAAEKGLPTAQVALGMMYQAGLGVERDSNEAVAWYLKAAAQGNSLAQFSLGATYRFGWGVVKDDKKAFGWYRKAAEQGYAAAQANLGMLYQSGLGVDKDDKAAAMWYRKAAEQGFALGQYGLGRFYEEGKGGLEKNDREALSWYQKAADRNFTPPAGTPAADDLWDEAIATRFERRRKEREAIAAPATIHSDVDKPDYKNPEDPDAFAVVIGVEKYASLPTADFAERDAEAVRAHLMALGYPARNIYFLSNQQATRAKIAQSLNTWLPKRVNKNSTVFFYYSGHGAPDPKTNQAYLVPMDGDPEDLDSTAYSIKQLYANLNGLNVRHAIVVLDSCFSGAGGRSVLAKGTRPLVTKIDLGVLPDKVIALTASDKDQISGTIEEQGHGSFTYYFLKGLGGAAQNKSGHVTLLALYDFLTPKVQDAARLHNRDQTPQLLPATASSEASSIQLK